MKRENIKQAINQAMNINMNNANPNTNLLTQLLTIYDRVMVLKLFVDGSDELQNKYCEAAHIHNAKLMQTPHMVDAGFDLFAPASDDDDPVAGNTLKFCGTSLSVPFNKLNFKLCSSAQMVTDQYKIFNTGFYLHPRSSLGKTSLRLANATGIIDAGYRGHLTALFDVLHHDDPHSYYYGQKFDRYVQLCAPGLEPILVEIVYRMEDLGEETIRGAGGIGSTGR